MTLPLVPLQNSAEADQLESELKALTISLFNQFLGAGATEIDRYGMPHLGSMALIKRCVTRDGLSVMRGTSDDRIDYLFRAWVSRNPERGTHFLRLYLLAVFGPANEVWQMWQRKSLPYPTALFTKGQIEATGESLSDYYLTSRLAIDIDTSTVPKDVVRSLRSSVAARLLLEIRVTKSFDGDDIGAGCTSQAGAFIRFQGIGT